MIRLDKHTNLDYSVINISAWILRKLTIKGTISYDKLLEDAIDGLGERAETNYPYALNFLFMLDKIVYNKIDDTFTLNEIT